MFTDVHYNIISTIQNLYNESWGSTVFSLWRVGKEEELQSTATISGLLLIYKEFEGHCGVSQKAKDVGSSAKEIAFKGIPSDAELVCNSVLAQCGRCCSLQ